MPNMQAPVKLGANIWNQYTDWPMFLDAMLRAEDLGFDSLFTWDHVYPIVGSLGGPRSWRPTRPWRRWRHRPSAPPSATL